MWEAPVRQREQNDGCPFCKGRKVCKHNSLARKAPDVAASWDDKANAGTPDDYTSLSNYTAQWRCFVCENSWTAQISQRVLRNTGCPHCYNFRRGRKEDGTRTSHPTLAACNHLLPSDWDDHANAKDGMFPQSITLGSSQRAHWVCHKCPKGLTHRWTAAVQNRVFRLSRCPCCYGRQVCQCNSLQGLFPNVAAEWDHDKNKLKPTDYASNSLAVVWWTSPDHGSWQQTIATRTDVRLKRHLKGDAKP